MTSKPMLSIIIPVYNTGQFLGPCLDSVVDQGQDGYEIIVIDDGSTDGSLKVAKDYESRYGFITVISQENQGVSAARNSGMTVATGQYIWFIDSDDLVVDGSLPAILNQLRNKVGMISFAMRKIDEYEGQEGKAKGSPEFTSLAVATDLLRRKNFQSSLYCNIFPVELIKGRSLDETLINNEDIDFTLDTILLADDAIVTNTPLYLYRQRSGSATSSFTLRRIEDSLKVIEKYIKAAGTLEDEASRNLLSYVAYLYVIALGSYALVGEHNPALFERLKNQSWLLQYGKGSRSVAINFTYRILGLRFLAGTLGLVIRMRGRRK